MGTTISGHVMCLYLEGHRIAAMKDVSLDLGTKFNDVNNRDTGDYDVVKPSRRNFKISGNGHFQFDATYSYEYLFGIWKAGSRVSVYIYKESTVTNIDTSDVHYFQASGIIDSLKANFPDHENSTYDISISGTTDMNLEDEL